MKSLKLFILECLPEFIAKKIQNGFERNPKGNFTASVVRLVFFILSVQYFIVRPYMVPTESMKNTIKSNDFLLVNRFIYGLRTPNNISIPFTAGYFVREIPTFQFSPRLREIKSNDIVVFRADHEEPPVEYVKRCVAAPGDNIKMIKGTIFVNDQEFVNSKNALVYNRFSPESITNDSNYLVEYRINTLMASFYGQGYLEGGLAEVSDFPTHASAEEILDDFIQISKQFTMTIENDIQKGDCKKNILELIRKIKNDERYAQKKSNLTYQNTLLDIGKSYFSRRQFAQISDITNFESIHVPKAGEQLILSETHPDIISNVVYYDGHQVEIKDGAYFIDGVQQNTYTVEQDYYFFIGDNRDNSLDSRNWGLVPDKFITGSPILIYFNLNENFWNSEKIMKSIFNIFSNIGYERIGQIIQ